jgi:hypothetical protein
MRKKWLAATAATMTTFATIMPSADALTPWQTFGAARASARSGAGPTPSVQVHSETRRDPRSIRFIADTHHEGRGFASWTLDCINFNTDRTGTRKGERGFSRRFCQHRLNLDPVAPAEN